MLAKSKTGFYWKNTSGGFHDGRTFRRHTSPFAIKGTSDILGVTCDGRFVALEVKDKGKATDEQLAFIQKVKEMGGVGGVVRSCDQARKVLEEAGVVFSE